MKQIETRKEQIEYARQIIAYGCSDELRDAFIQDFPELAGSEDERIRKWLVDYFSSIKETVWIHRDITCGQILSYLEKQKENPKSADYIPSDCVSDAKCEDRWHKVGDSLPDNPREVLCKDEIGYYFIGRYYIGEGWDISNYDDEDTPHRLNPPVSKWIDIPSEKQKEQKPAWSEEEDEVRANRIYLKGYNDAVRNQKPVEWSEEDEERLKSIIHRTEVICGKSPFGEIKLDLDWLKSLPERFNLPPKQEWSEDDDYLMDVKAAVNDYFDEGYAEELCTWLKSLRSKPHWKPSEEQMEALAYASQVLGSDLSPRAAKASEELENLCEQLKKL